jgi:hypothetical protein
VVFPQGKLPDVPMRPDAAAEFDRWLGATVEGLSAPNPTADPFTERTRSRNERGGVWCFADSGPSSAPKMAVAGSSI